MILFRWVGLSKAFNSSPSSNTGLDKAIRKLKIDKRCFELLFHNMSQGLAYCKIVFDNQGNPVDYVYLDVNEVYEKITGMRREDVIGKRATQIIPKLSG